jgi:glutamine phosphoribosylpyrophosphate amidotransferase
VLFRSGIIVNEGEIWESLTIERKYKIDSEVINAIAIEHLKHNKPIEELPNVILEKCKGVVSCALLIQDLGKLILF